MYHKGESLRTKIAEIFLYSVSFGFLLSKRTNGVRVQSIESMTDTKLKVSSIVYCVCVCVCACVAHTCPRSNSDTLLTGMDA